MPLNAWLKLWIIKCNKDLGVSKQTEIKPYEPVGNSERENAKYLFHISDNIAHISNCY